MKKIKGVIDPGHGGIDRSNRGPTGYIEADGMLVLSKLIKNKLNSTGFFDVVLTRDIDKTVSLLDRIEIAKDFNAVFFLSQHTNAFSASARGSEVFYSVARPGSKELAEAISYRLATEFNTLNRGGLTKKNSSGTDYYGLLRYGSNAGIENVFIVESLFHSNPIEEAILKSPQGMEKIADIQAEEVCRFYGLTYKKEGAMSPTIEQKVEIMWKKMFGDTEIDLPNLPELPTIPQNPTNPTKPVLKRGSRGSDVKYLQSLLNKEGFILEEDSSFGPAVERAVKGFQLRYKLIASGIVDAITWSTLIVKTQNQKVIYSKLRRFNSDVHVLDFSPDDYHLDFEFGKAGVLEKPTEIANNTRKKGLDIAAVVNFGFFVFGSTIEHLGSRIDDGKYYAPPNAEFIDVIYGKNKKMIIENYSGYDGPFLSGLQSSAYWMAGLSYRLLKDGRVDLENSSKYPHATNSEPRTLIGQKENGNIVIVVVDGRTSASTGITARQSAELMLELGARVAANADGGGSSVMGVFNGEEVVKVSRPSYLNIERAVGSVLTLIKIPK